MKTTYSLLLIILLAIGIKSNAQDCSGNLTPAISSSEGTCGGPEKVYCVEGQTITFTLSITDGNNDMVTLNTPDITRLLPASATISQALPYNAQAPYTVTVTWTPVASEVHVDQEVKFQVTDPCTGTNCILVLYALDSCDVNLTPLIGYSVGACGDTLNGRIGEATTITLFVTDGNNDVVTLDAPYSAYPLPASATTSPALPYTGQTPFSVTVTWTPTPAEYLVYQRTRWLVTDHCTGSICDLKFYAECSMPTITTCPSDITQQADEPDCQTEVYFAAIADGIPAPTVSYTHPSLSLFDLGTTPVTVSATNTCGTATCSFNVNVTPPELTVTCPGNITLQANSSGCSRSNVTFLINAYSAIGIANLSVDHPSGSTFPLGTTTVHATATDDCGNSATCSFDVTITAVDPPQVTCSPDITLPANASGCSRSNVTFVASASSTLGLSSFNTVPASGSTFPLGTTTVIATALDVCGSTSTCSFNVTITNPLSVNAGTDVSTIFGYATTQTVTRTAIVSGGPASSYSWTLSRALKCNQVNSTGDELFTGGSCTNNICPATLLSTAAAPSCSGSNTISATLLEPADACVTVTNSAGCSATDCFHIDAIDGRCFAGNSGKNKAKICHHVGGPNNQWITICIPKSNQNSYLANHPGDYLGPCTSRLEADNNSDENSFTFFPNPFSSIGTIRFIPEEDAHAVMEVFSSTGEKVASLFSGNVIADEPLEIKFDGSQLARGIYLCRLITENQNYYVRMILDK